MAKIHAAEQYALDIISGVIPSCKYTHLSCQRYLDDKKIALERGWYFDTKAAIRVINFFERVLKHYQGKWAGKPFLLLGWQKFILWNLYGWKNANGTRRITEVAIFVPRKNGKTELASGCGLYGMDFDGERAAEVYSTATDKNQARIAFDKAVEMVKQSTTLTEYLEPMANAIVGLQSASTFKPWSSDTKKKDGYNPSFAIVDEYHEHVDNRMIDVINSGIGARENPITFIVTTAGFNMQSVCYKYQNVCQEILEGKKQQDNLFTIIYTADTGDDWESEKTWIKANPSWSEIDTMQNQMRLAYKKAKNSGDYVNFKTKHLNIWTQSAEEWVDSKLWKAAAEQYDVESMKGQICYAGLDLSDTLDVTSLCLFFPETMRFLWWFWIPEEKLNNHRKDDRVDYGRWADEGYITVTPGNVIDYDSIRRTVTGFYIKDGLVLHDDNCIADIFQLESIGYDPWNSRQLAIRLSNDDGLVMNIYRQGYQTMSFPTKEFKTKIYGNEIHHNNNPVVNWMIGNCVPRRDPNENIMLDKSKSKNKIDGIVASVIAFGEYLNLIDNEPYKDGIRTL